MADGGPAIMSDPSRIEDLTGPIPARVALTLDGLFRERVRRTPEAIACREFDRVGGVWRDYRWTDIDTAVGRWRAALAREGFERGARVALKLHNGRHWMIFDQAALSLGLVVVPLYPSDRPDNLAWVLEHAGAALLLVETAAEWEELVRAGHTLHALRRIVILEGASLPGEPRSVAASEWLSGAGDPPPPVTPDPEALASLVYTSGTTGRPKGVMLSHRNMLENAESSITASGGIGLNDVCLSFLPLSHTLERTAGYYMMMMAGATIAYARSVADLADDLQTIRPTLLISVPRIYERVHARIRAMLDMLPVWRRHLFQWSVTAGWKRFEYTQGHAPWHPWLLAQPLLDRICGTKLRARLGGRVRMAISGGAPLPFRVAKVFIALGVPVLQGYGLTESSPVISVNRPGRNKPVSIGIPIPGVEVGLGPNDELLARGPNIMRGYWRDEEATLRAIDAEGWLHTGDKARIDAEGFIHITGRIKEIIVLANGEKIPPADMEAAIMSDPLFEHVLIVGEGMPYLAALVVLDAVPRAEVERSMAIVLGHAGSGEQLLLSRIANRLAAFPGYAQVRRVAVCKESWTVENGLLTPTLKLRRGEITERHRAAIEHLYEGHPVE